MKNSKRGIRIVFNSPVILGFVLICFLVTLLNEHTGGRSNQLLFVTYHSSFKDPLTYVRFFTHVFGHSGWDHFLGNMTYILLLGPMLEEKYSSKNILKVFLITALVTALINYIFWFVRSQWYCLCFYRNDLLYRIPQRRHSAYFSAGCCSLYRTAGL